MSQLEYPDRHHLSAAQGWLELGALDEADREFTLISPPNRFHPEALDFRWHYLAARHNWEAALDVARLRVKAAPFSASGWIQQSFALHELRRTEEAFDELHRVATRFADVGTIPYNLACYTCRLGRIDETRHWLQRAFELQGRKETIALAAEDPDLEAIRPELNAL